TPGVHNNSITHTGLASTERPQGPCRIAVVPATILSDNQSHHRHLHFFSIQLLSVHLLHRYSPSSSSPPVPSPKPTLEDARSWSMSFERLMKSAAGRGCFRQFLRTEFSEENMMFWLACEELKKETNKTVVEEKVRQVYEDFISILSPKEVSLDSRVREVINRNMLDPTSHTFEDAQKQIYTLMQRDSYPRYMNSSAYTDLLKDLEEPKTEP
uniref:RGS domain-containing protein n=1 Tax=Gadus morhua TaxID=8049 RepID=A0A8C4Z321_GADMO